MKNANLLGSLLVLLGFATLATPQTGPAAADVPVFKITPENSTIKFAVKASVAIEGQFDKWNASLTFYLY